MALGAMLSDVGSGTPEASMAIMKQRREREQLQQRQQALQQLGTAIQGGGQTAGSAPSVRGAMPALLAASQAGVDIGDYVSLLDKTQPDIAYENGQRYDRRDPSSAPRFAPNLDNGQEPVYDGRGNVVGVRNMDGLIQSVAERERAVNDARNASQASYAGAIAEATAAGQGRGSSPYQIETVQGPDGRPITASRQQLLQAGPIYGQSQAQQTEAVGQAERNVELASGRTQAESRLQAADQAAGNLRNGIRTALGQINGMSTGLIGQVSGGIPGTPARDLRATIETLKARIGFDYLQQMRELSPTGGALGQIAIQEMQALQSVLGNLDPTQSPEQLTRNLQQIDQMVEQGQRLRQQTFAQQYGGQTQGAPQPSGPRPRARNPQTRQVVEFNGSQWVPVQ